MSRKRPTKEDVKRFQKLQDIGCVACRHEGLMGIPSDIHHITSNGRRISHSHTIPLCPWHHRGVGPDFGNTVAIGPSLAVSKTKFQKKYGSELDLLAEVNELIK